MTMPTVPTGERRLRQVEHLDRDGDSGHLLTELTEVQPDEQASEIRRDPQWRDVGENWHDGQHAGHVFMQVDAGHEPDGHRHAWALAARA